MYPLYLLFLLFALPLNCYEVISISDAIVDYTIFVQEGDLPPIAPKKGGWRRISEKDFIETLQRHKNVPIITPGGTATNTLKILAHLGHSSALYTIVGEDSAGRLFQQKMQEHGVLPLVSRRSSATGCCLIMVTPDGERTMMTTPLPSCADICLDPSHFDNLKLLHIDGYQLKHNTLLTTAAKMVHAKGGIVSCELGSAPVVEENRSFLDHFLMEEVDIVFANSDEAAAYTHLPPMEACRLLAMRCGAAVVTMGKEGAWVGCKDQLYLIPARNVAVIDTTGAGDAFIGGFLDGYLRGLPLERCAWQGTLLASHVIQHVGAEIPSSFWPQIFAELADK